MTRIGRIIAPNSDNPDMPRFALVVENGAVQLGCWRFVEYTKDGRAIFARVS